MILINRYYNYWCILFRSCPPSPSSSSISSSSGPPSPTRIDGLSQLTALVQKGERKGIFKDKMPAAIQRVVSSCLITILIKTSIVYYNRIKNLNHWGIQKPARGFELRTMKHFFTCLAYHFSVFGYQMKHSFSCLTYS